MKMTLLLLITISLSVFAIAQEKQNSFKVGTTIEYDVRPNGNQLKCFLTIDKLLEDTVSFAWMMPATMNRDEWSGKIIVTGPSLHASEIGYWDPPVNEDEMVLPGYQNFLMIPRDRYAKLKKTGQMEFDGQTFNTIMNEFGGFVEYVVGHDKIRALRANSTNGNTSIWILDDHNFPLLLRMDGNPYYLDFELVGLKQGNGKKEIDVRLFDLNNQ